MPISRKTRKTLPKVTSALFLALAVHCSSVQKELEDFDFSQRGPLEFLSFLEREASARSFYTIDEPLRGWIRREHLPRLMVLIDSTRPCAGVVLSISSYLPLASTVGNEAAFLIEGFRQGRYPPSLHSGGDLDARRTEIHRWWQLEAKNLVLPPP
jgi:hypothetical protein